MVAVAPGFAALNPGYDACDACDACDEHGACAAHDAHDAHDAYFASVPAQGSSRKSASLRRSRLVGRPVKRGAAAAAARACSLVSRRSATLAGDSR